METMKNILNQGPGKGDAPRNCHTEKFREGFDGAGLGKDLKPRSGRRFFKRYPRQGVPVDVLPDGRALGLI